MITIDTILERLQIMVEEKQPISASVWLDASAKMTVLMESVQNELFELEQRVAQKKIEYIEGGDSVAKANVKVQILPEYLEVRKRWAKLERVVELVRISKLQARMSDDNLRSQ